jgi:phosphoribosyl-ATP pyrophosphohydrolase/phosphoribosyl-AMP cyclohydrolase
MTELTFDDRGLVPAIVQDERTGRVLMLGYVNRESLQATERTGLVHFWSRSRNRLWRKGESSGNTLAVRSMTPDCDGDAVLIQAVPAGPTCHTGAISCFGQTPADQGFAWLERLWEVIAQRNHERPDGSYTARLLAGGTDSVGRKVVEEATEVLLAAKDHAAGAAGDDRLAEEAADLVYHLLVLLAERGLAPSRMIDVLASRRH